MTQNTDWVARLEFTGDWLFDRFSEATDVQIRAWEHISCGEHLLVFRHGQPASENPFANLLRAALNVVAKRTS